jgi:NADH dehydrogenase
MNDAIRLKEQVLKTFEAVEKNPSLIDDGALNFCVVGGGATGVEVCGALADLLHTQMKEDYPNLPLDRAQVLLYEYAPHLLGSFKPELPIPRRGAVFRSKIIRGFLPSATSPR